jgi:hypothetical protein
LLRKISLFQKTKKSGGKKIKLPKKFFNLAKNVGPKRGVQECSKFLDMDSVKVPKSATKELRV